MKESLLSLTLSFVFPFFFFFFIIFTVVNFLKRDKNLDKFSHRYGLIRTIDVARTEGD